MHGSWNSLKMEDIKEKEDIKEAREPDLVISSIRNKGILGEIILN